MDTLESLIAFLDKPDDELWGNIWSDDALRLLRDDYVNLLPEIFKQWRDWPVGRQEHLAFLLGDIGAPDERALAIEMLSASDPHVQSRAQEALDEL